MEQSVRQALSAIYQNRFEWPGLRALFNKIEDINESCKIGRFSHIKDISPKQTEEIINHIGIANLETIPLMGPKRVTAILQYAGIEPSPHEYWLIYYEYMDKSGDRMGCNIYIKQSPVSWLNKHRKAFPDELVMLKFAMKITEEEYLSR
jgi:hypothetical protein